MHPREMTWQGLIESSKVGSTTTVYKHKLLFFIKHSHGRAHINNTSMAKANKQVYNKLAFNKTEFKLG